MSDHIKRLYLESLDEQQNFCYQRFAKMIVEESCTAIKNTDRHRSDYFIAKIKEHFGETNEP